MSIPQEEWVFIAIMVLSIGAASLYGLSWAEKRNCVREAIDIMDPSEAVIYCRYAK